MEHALAFWPLLEPSGFGRPEFTFIAFHAQNVPAAVEQGGPLIKEYTLSYNTIPNMV